MRILILIAIGLLLYIIVGNILRKNKMSSSKPEADTQKMVQCHHCNLHILEAEALKSGQYFYCSQNHLEADTQSQ